MRDCGRKKKNTPSSENLLQNLVSCPTMEVNVEPKRLLLTFIKISSFVFSVKIKFVWFITRVELVMTKFSFLGEDVLLHSLWLENAFKHLNTCTIKRSHVLTIVDNHRHICWVQYHNGQSEAFINLLNSVQNAFLGEPTPFKGVVHIQNSVIIYTPSCHFKPVWITVLCRILNNVGNRTAQPPFTIIVWTQNQCKWMGGS